MIEQALARHIGPIAKVILKIGPIAKVILKRAMAQNLTRADFCEYLATHIEQEDARRQFLATLSRWV